MRMEENRDTGRQHPDRPYPFDFGIPPKYSISEAVGFLKGKSAIKLFDFHLELKRRYWGRHFWARGYCVSTVGLDEAQIRNYVRYQLHKDKQSEQIKLWKN